jgi:hypothetical protein
LFCGNGVTTGVDALLAVASVCCRVVSSCCFRSCSCAAFCPDKYIAAFSGIVVKTFLNPFRQFNKVNLRDSRFGSKHNAVRFDAADRGVLVIFAANRFEVIGQREWLIQRRQNYEHGFPMLHWITCICITGWISHTA